MISKTIENYKKLPRSLQGSLMLVISNFFSWVLLKVFFNIYVYLINNSFVDLIIYNIILSSLTSVFYILTSVLINKFNLNLKVVLKFWFLLIPISFLYLLFTEMTMASVLVFTVMWAIWRWLFYNTYHLYELNFTDPNKRPFMYSLRSTWYIVAWLLVSGLISLFFYFEKHLLFGFSAYDMMFILLAFIMFWSYFFVIDKLEDLHIQKKIEFSDYKWIFFKKWYRRLWLVILVNSYSSIVWILFSMVSFYILKSEFNVWIYEFIFTIFWILATLTIGNYLRKEKSYNVLALLAILYFTSYIVLANFLNIYVFIWFSLIATILFPAVTTMLNVYMMSINDILTKHNWNSYANLQYKEFMNMFGRLVVMLSFLVFAYLSNDIEWTLYYWIILAWWVYLVIPILLWHIRD